MHRRDHRAMAILSWVEGSEQFDNIIDHLQYYCCWEIWFASFRRIDVENYGIIGSISCVIPYGYRSDALDGKYGAGSIGCRVGVILGNGEVKTPP